MLFKRQWSIHLTYYDEIKDQLYDTNKDDISKANDISVEVDDFKESNEALEYQCEVCNGEKVKTEPTSLKMRTKNHWRIKTRGEDLMLVMLKKLKQSLKSLKFRLGFNFYSSKCINKSALLKCSAWECPSLV